MGAKALKWLRGRVHEQSRRPPNRPVGAPPQTECENTVDGGSHQVDHTRQLEHVTESGTASILSLDQEAQTLRTAAPLSICIGRRLIGHGSCGVGLQLAQSSCQAVSGSVREHASD